MRRWWLFVWSFKNASEGGGFGPKSLNRAAQAWFCMRHWKFQWQVVWLLQGDDGHGVVHSQTRGGVGN